LGRGGSDTAAAYLASRIGAKRVEIWTDVPGLFTANPHMVPEARLIRRLTYDEAETLATMGAAALHPRCIRPVRHAGIPMQIAWTDHPDLEGTVIASGAGDPGIKAISSRNGLCLVSMRRPPSWQPVGFMADIAECFRRHDLCMDLVSSSPSDIRTTVDLEADPGAPDRIDDLLRNLNQVSRASVIPDVASVSLVGREIRSVLPTVAETLQYLEGHPIHLLSQSANDFSLAYVTEQESALPMVRAIHGELFRDIPTCDTFGDSWERLTKDANGTAGEGSTESELAVAS
jgi:diaminopimelate decarboxylase/aspartate kinase